MDEFMIQAKLEEASEHYNGGRYQEAIRLWEEVLASDPVNEKARDGIQMASLLVDQFSGASAPQPRGDMDDTAPVMREARVQAGISRVKELLSEGNLDEALEGCALLEDLAPDLDEVKKLAGEIRTAAGNADPSAAAPAETDLESLLAEARRALEEGRNEEAAAAAMKAATIDPGNAEACGIIALVGDSHAVGKEQAAEPADIPMPELDLDGATQAIPAVPEPSPRSDIPDPALAIDDAQSGSKPDRIGALIREGQQAFNAGRFEGAIAAWSRIFAIDQTNAQAGSLIDQAKEALEGRARELDEMLYSAADARDAGRTEEAIRTCNKILEKNPEHVEALALLEELNSPADAGADEITIGIDRKAVEEAAAEKKQGTTEETLFRESVPLAPPPRVPRREERPMPHEPARRSSGGRMLAAALVVIGAAAGAGWYFWFGGIGNAGPRVQMTPPPVPPSPRPPDTPGPAPQQQAPQQNASLQVLPVTPAPAQPEEPDEAPDGQEKRSQARSLEKEGRRHFADGDWTAAVLALREARQLDPVHFNSESMLDDAMERLEAEARLERQVRKAIQAFDEHDYGSALHAFYRLQEDDEAGRSYDRHIRNSWFNWGVILLREGSLDEARQKFVEVRDMTPSDMEARRAIETIDRYESRIVDEAFDSFVSSLKLRTLD